MKYLPDILYKDKHEGGVKTSHLQAVIALAEANYSTPQYMGSTSDRNSMAQFIERNLSNSEMQRLHETLVAQYRATGGRAFARGRPPGAKNKSNNADYDAAKRAMEYNNSNTQGFEAPSDDDAMSNDDLARELGIEPVKTEQITEVHVRQDLSNYVTKPELNDVAKALQHTIEGSFNNLELQFNSLVAKVDNIKELRPTIVELKRVDLPTVNLGQQHRNFPLLLQYCSSQLRGGYHLNIWIYGPAGTGKSTACANVALALFAGRDMFYSNGKISYAHELLGHMHGDKYITTQFRLAYETGGVYCADEVDGWLPDALIALNGALANGHCAFPDKMVKRHKDFIFIGAANTTGLGSDMEYVARMQQDAAFNDRCVMLHWPLDEALEDGMCANKDWLRIVRVVRANVKTYKIKGHLITPRAAIFGEALLAAGVDLENVKISTLKKGMTDAQWSQAIQGI